jgi:hypothetical protein
MISPSKEPRKNQSHETAGMTTWHLWDLWDLCDLCAANRNNCTPKAVSRRRVHSAQHHRGNPGGLVQSPPAWHDSLCRSVALLRQKKQVPAHPRWSLVELPIPRYVRVRAGTAWAMPLAQRLACNTIHVAARFPGARCHGREAHL